MSPLSSPYTLRRGLVSSVALLKTVTTVTSGHDAGLMSMLLISMFASPSKRTAEWPLMAPAATDGWAFFSLDDAETFGTRGFVQEASLPAAADFMASSPVSQRARPLPGIGASAGSETLGTGVAVLAAGAALDVVAAGAGGMG